MDTISKYLNLFNLPFFNSSNNTAQTASKVVGTTHKIATTASKSIASLHTLTLSPGVLFGTLVVVGVLILALTLGRTRTLVSLLALYVAFALQTIFPFYGWLLKQQSFATDLPTIRVFVFLILYGLVFGLLNRTLLKSRFNLAEASFLSVVLMGLVQLGFIVSIIINLAPSFYNIAARVPADFVPYLA